MPALTTVVGHKSGGKVALCSCGWEGEVRTDPSDAYRDKAHHQRDQHSGTTTRVVKP